MSPSTDFRQRERLIKQLAKVLAAIHHQTDRLKARKAEE